MSAHRFSRRPGGICITNDGGSWVSEFRGFTPGGDRNHYLLLLSGEGGYEGLSAMLLMLPVGASGEWEVEGVIAPDPLPEPPEWVLPPAE